MALAFNSNLAGCQTPTEQNQMKDIKLSGIKDVFKRRTENQRLSMSRYLDEKFFNVAKTAVVNANKLTKSKTDDIVEVIEELIVKAESTKNDNVDDVDRELFSVDRKSVV